MDLFSALLIGLLAGWALRMHDQRTRIALLGRHLAKLQLERHLETLTQGYTRAIHETTEARQLQVLESFAQAEQTVAAQAQALADAMQTESAPATCMSLLPIYIPYATRFLPIPTRDFRQVLRIHATGLRHMADNAGGWGRQDARLPPFGRTVPAAAQLPLVLQIARRGRRAADAAPPGRPPESAGLGVRRDPHGLPAVVAGRRPGRLA